MVLVGFGPLENERGKVNFSFFLSKGSVEDRKCYTSLVNWLVPRVSGRGVHSRPGGTNSGWVWISQRMKNQKIEPQLRIGAGGRSRYQARASEHRYRPFLGMSRCTAIPPKESVRWKDRNEKSDE